MASVDFEGVAVVADGVVLVADVDLHVADGEVVAVVGPSGSGKSTLLRAIAGLAEVVEGRLSIGGVDVTDRQPGERDVSMVFQEPTLLPRRTARGNVAFPLELRQETLEAIRDRVDAEARALHIEHLLGQTPATLSRGEGQLVQIARAMVRVPSVLLLDEPFAPLDEPRRHRLRREIALLQRGYGVTTVVASNDPDDARRFADRVAVLERPDARSPGRVVQVGTPDEVRNEPATLDGAAALGSLWVVPVVVRVDTRGAWLVGRTDPSFRLRAWAAALSARDGDDLVVGLRGDDVVPASTGAHRATLVRSIPGSDPQTVLEIAGHTVVTPHPVDAPRGATIRVDLVRTHLFDREGRRVA